MQNITLKVTEKVQIKCEDIKSEVDQKIAMKLSEWTIQQSDNRGKDAVPESDMCFHAFVPTVQLKREEEMARVKMGLVYVGCFLEAAWYRWRQDGV